MKKLLIALAVTMAFALTAVAQTNVGRMVGTVSGPDGALPGATVVVTDNKTGRERTVTTNDVGGFIVPQLEHGDYTVKVTAAGFKTFTINNVTIVGGQDYSLPVTLEVGQITEQVTVQAGQDLVNASNAEISSTVTTKQITELPLAARNPLSLVLLQSGTASNPSQNTTINGQRTSATNIVRDGINIQDNFIRSNATDFSPGRPSVDDVSEFTLTTQADASRGFGGAQVELVTPRGGNEFHGVLFAYNRNSRFGANTFFNNRNGTPRPFRNRNQFGGNISGPILRDKLFFFGFYERLTDRLPTTKLTTVLTPSARAGNFTYVDAAGVTRTVNLLSLPTSAFAAGNPSSAGVPLTINTALFNRFIATSPQGNSTECGDGLNTTCYRFVQKSDQDRHTFTTRIDYDVNSTNSINAVYNRSLEGNLRSDIDGAFNPTPVVVQPSKNNFLALAWRSQFTSNFVNELRGGIFYSKPDFLRTQDNPAAFFTLPLVTNPEVSFQEQGRYVKTTNLQDTADLIWGDHSLRFGGQFQNVDIEAYNDVGIVPTFGIGVGTNTPQILTASFTNTTLFPGTVPTATRATANGLYALLTGIVNSGAQSFNVTSQTSGFVPGATQQRNFRYQAYSGFIVDNWRASQSLTLNLGLRYDLYTALESTNGLALEPKIEAGQTVQQAVLNPNGVYQFVGGNAGKAGRFYRPDKNNFSPVIGVAYAIPSGGNWFSRTLFGRDRETVIRGGFRFSYINDELVRAPDNALTGNEGLRLTGNVFNPATNTTSINERFGSVSAIPTPTFVSNRTFAQNNAAAGLFGTVFAVDPNIESPRVMEYSVGFSREIGWDTAIELRYVGSSSKNLLRGIDLNQVDIRGNGFLADFNRARNNLLLCQATTGCTTGGNFNAAVPGSQQLSVFPNLGGGGLLTNATVTGQLIAGTPADLAIVYVTNNLAGTVRFLPNPNAGVADILLNGAEYYYNSMQFEVRRRFSQGLTFQGNYTFSKNLTNGQGTGQTRFEPFLDIANQNLEWSRADYDQTHVINFNMVYELPFGNGKQFFNQGGIVNTLLGGWQLNTIFRLGSGAPITFTDARGTLNRAGRSGRQTALTSLTKEQLKEIVGVYRTPCGIFFVNPAVININQANLTAGNCNQLNVGATGRAANGFGSTPFAGQVFFNNAPGQTSGLERAVVNGPWTHQFDLSVFKNFQFGERYRLQLRAEAFNVLNNVDFIPPQFIDISSTTFGRVTSSTAPRVMQFAFRFNF